MSTLSGCGSLAESLAAYCAGVCAASRRPRVSSSGLSVATSSAESACAAAASPADANAAENSSSFFSMPAIAGGWSRKIEFVRGMHRTCSAPEDVYACAEGLTCLKLCLKMLRHVHIAASIVRCAAGAH